MSTTPLGALEETLRKFFRMEAAGGVLLVIATLLAMATANSPLEAMREAFLNLGLGIKVGAFAIDKPLLLWINDGLMAIFFFHVGLELKRELCEGELANPRQIALPALAAIGGVVVPALIYIAFNSADPIAMKGWAIPAATDIAFAIGVLSLLGSRVPLSLKVFLLTLAILDDMVAIIIIALFYSGEISTTALSVAAVAIALLFILNRAKVSQTSTYILVGIVLWAAVLKSGVHATLAGVVLALFIPMRDAKDPTHSPLKALEENLHHSVAFVILPVFAYANAGINFSGMGLPQLLDPVALGVSLGLFLGKPIGVMLFTALALMLRVASMPEGASWRSLFGISMLCGIGFTMSLFIGSLAFEAGGNYGFDERIGIVCGSLLSAVCGYLWLNWALPKKVEVA